MLNLLKGVKSNKTISEDIDTTNTKVENDYSFLVNSHKHYRPIIPSSVVNTTASDDISAFFEEYFPISTNKNNAKVDSLNIKTLQSTNKDLLSNTNNNNTMTHRL